MQGLLLSFYHVFPASAREILFMTFVKHDEADIIWEDYHSGVL